MLAIETFTRAVASLHRAGNLVDELSSSALLAEMWTVAGRPSKARELCRRALSASEALGMAAARATADLHVQLAELDVDTGDQASAEEHLMAAMPLEAYEPSSESRYRWFTAAARLAETGATTSAPLRSWTRRTSTTVPGTTRTCDRSRRCGQGCGSRAGTWTRPPTGRPTVGCRARMRSAISGSTSTSRWRVSSSNSTRARRTTRVLLLGRLEETAEREGRRGSLADIQSLLALTQGG